MTIEQRCYAVVGTATYGPRYCGNKAKAVDANGRPICGVHKKGNPGIEWRGEGHITATQIKHSGEVVR